MKLGHSQTNKMFTKEDLIAKLEKNNRSINLNVLNKYLKLWRIDAVYEDENNIEYFDETAIFKLNQGIILKDQDTPDEQIISIINRGIIKAVTPTPVETLPLPQEAEKPQLEKITVDVTNQTLNMLADSIVQKISIDLADKLVKNNFMSSTFDAAKLQRDNEILASQVAQLLEENKKLLAQNKALFEENNKFKNVFGHFYIKQG
ncbi:MAG: hypothetical protein MZV70_76405 [Desulfobacterales bacterium]|nr:hypothetical protein [Desulfobacterales bacterium]